MRVTIAALSVILGLIAGVNGIARLTPDEVPAWIKVTLAMLWLMALVATAFLFGNKGHSRILSDAELRDGLIYIGIALIVVAVIISIGIRDLEHGIRRNYHENWIVCLMTAAIVSGYALKAFWRIRRSRSLWLVLAVYLALHFSILVPTLRGLGHVPAYYVTLIGMCETAVLFFILNRVMSTKRERGLS